MLLVPSITHKHKAARSVWVQTSFWQQCAQLGGGSFFILSVHIPTQSAAEIHHSITTVHVQTGPHSQELLGARTWFPWA